MAGPYILVHDLGTTGDKALLLDLDRRAIVASATYEFRTIHPNQYWAEQDPEEWWRGFIETSRNVIHSAGVKPDEVIAIGFSGQMMACLPVDGNGHHLRNAIIWMDQRSVKEADEIRSVIGEERFYRVTGNRISPTYPVAKILWLKRNEPHIYEKARYFLQAKDYIASRLTGEFFTDYSDASLSGMMDISKRCWAEEVLSELSIDIEKLPRILSSTSIVGEVDNRVAKDIGVRGGVPVIIGCGDGACATVGAGAIDKGDAYICLGSSAWLSVTAEKPIFDIHRRLFNMAHVDPQLYSPIGTMQTAGAALKWFKDNVFVIEKVAAEVLDLSPYEIIDKEAQLSPPGAHGLLFLPYLAGERAPWWSPYARGVILGLTLSHKRSDIARAVLEGVAMNLALIAQIFNENNIQLSEPIYMIGGGARSEIWPQILASILGHTIAIPRYTEEATALGAAIVTAIGIKQYRSLKEIHSINPITRIFKVSEKDRDVYLKMVEIFRKAYLVLEPLFKEISSSA